MSTEEYPQQDNTVDELIARCERAIARDRLLGDFESPPFHETDRFFSCEQVRKKFETDNQLIYHPHARFMDVLDLGEEGQEEVGSLSLIVLEEPTLHLPGFLPDGRDLVITTNTDIQAGYVDIVLQSSVDRHNKDYSGPHIIIRFDTNNLVYDVRMPGFKEGIYDFIIPLKDVAISSKHRAFEFN